MCQALGWGDDIYWACTVWRMFWEADAFTKEGEHPFK